MSQLDRTHDHGPDFDQSLQAILGLARLLSRVETLGPTSDAARSRPGLCQSSASSSDRDPALLAVLGVIAVACELRPMIEALRDGSPQRLNVGEIAETPGEIERIVEAGAAHREQVGRAGLLR